jgi:hypothetical protein
MVIEAGDYELVTHFPLGFTDYQFIFKANETLDIFITTNNTHASQYNVTGMIPSGVLVNYQGSEGTINVTFTNPEEIHYIILGNINGTDAVNITWEVLIRSVTSGNLTVPDGVSRNFGIDVSIDKTYCLTYTANGTLQVFITDDILHIVEYSSTGIVPQGVLGNYTGDSGSIDLCNSSCNETLFLVFGNKNGMLPINVAFNFSAANGGSNLPTIPSFELISVSCVLVTILCIFGIRENSKMIRSLKSMF